MAYAHAQYFETYIPRSMDTLGSRLRRKRRERGWTQEELALRAGTNQAVIQKIENGKSLRPRKIDQIAAVLDVNPAWLMFGEKSSSELDPESVEVAKTWSSLPEPIRSRIKRSIFEQAMLHSQK
ncbi:helix-turn-helix domain-containing protein [endosymbiont of Ridgeia piscesae]|jgi:transcriptional regulator with XRE-family HTH domain|uniref:Transcriptional regulator n=1 Tax=endosymbiont of Ridgeia piscesae TaxID=54398 RepID=A0A0T5Z700_9GAMM|nr:helix-turn-helix transcriptional regulator [endosymbiont of Ridgeia piscesae]KRT53759.1 Transcriptional regulator [endosymbiont of Ridgeia piscesae]KRT58559.1 Transcriptional regulator, contains XRE-family HTH domain [endosymbiont of Ridgeia piscesae]